MSDAPKDPPETDETGKEAAMAHDHDYSPETPEEPKENLIHFNPWRDFNDAAPQIDTAPVLNYMSWRVSVSRSA